MGNRAEWQPFFCLPFLHGVLDEDSRKHLVPDTSFVTEEERNVKWWGHLMSREEELKETSAIWFSRWRSTNLWPITLFGMHSLTPQWLITLCVWREAGEMINWAGCLLKAYTSHFMSQRGYPRILYAVKRKQYTQSELIMSSRTSISGRHLEGGNSHRWSQRKRLCPHAMSLKVGKRQQSLYVSAGFTSPEGSFFREMLWYWDVVMKNTVCNSW